MKTAEQIAETNRIKTALDAGQVEQVWVIEVTAGTPGISEITSEWHLIPAEKADSEDAAIRYCTHFDGAAEYPLDENERPIRIEGNIVTSVFARKQVAIPGYLDSGSEADTIPAADSIDELRQLLCD